MPIDRRDATVRLATALALAATTGSVWAQDAVEAFYKGRQINLIVGYGPGGGYDLTARLLARHLGRFMPGNPSIAVQNLAGAGSLRAANFLYGAAPKDGATFGLFLCFQLLLSQQNNVVLSFLVCQLLNKFLWPVCQ